MFVCACVVHASFCPDMSVMLHVMIMLALNIFAVVPESSPHLLLYGGQFHSV